MDNIQTNMFPRGSLNRPRSDLQVNVAQTPQVVTQKLGLPSTLG